MTVPPGEFIAAVPRRPPPTARTHDGGGRFKSVELTHRVEQYPVEGAGPSDPSSGGVVLVPANPGLVVVFRSEVKVHGRDQRRGEDPGPPFRALHPAHRRPAPHRDPRGAGEDFAEQVVHAPRLQGGYPAERPIQPRPDIIAGGARDDSIHPQPAEFLRDGAFHRARRSDDIPARPPPRRHLPPGEAISRDPAIIRPVGREPREFRLVRARVLGM